MMKNFLTEENFVKLDKIIEKYINTKGGLMPVLNDAQKIFGYLPIEVQKKISEGLDIPLAEIYGVITFYSQFPSHDWCYHGKQICWCNS